MDNYGFGFNFDFLMNEHLKWKVLGVFFLGLPRWIGWLCRMSVDALLFQSNLGMNPYMRLLISSISVAQFLRKTGKRNVLQLNSSFVTKRKQNRRKT